jgi:hypothetical protein
MDRKQINNDAVQVQRRLEQDLAGNQCGPTHMPAGGRATRAENAAKDKNLSENPPATKVGGYGPKAL